MSGLVKAGMFFINGKSGILVSFGIKKRISFMNFCYAVLFSFILSLNAKAQLNHFIYVESENKQPFYIKLNEQIFSTSSAGYLIIPKLQDGAYKLNIGFPKNEWPVHQFDIVISKKDYGFMLKNFESKGWGLFNFQSMDVVMSAGKNEAVTYIEPAKIESLGDGFSGTLEDAVKVAAGQQDIVSETPQKSIINPKEKAEKIKPLSAKTIQKIFSAIDETGRSVIYIDETLEKKDTIRIFMVYENIGNTFQPGPSSIKAADVSDSIRNVKENVKNNFVNADTVQANTPVKNNTAVIGDEATGNQSTYKVTEIETGCKAFATDDDFLKLRKKMAAQDNDKDMINAAKKSFKSKCFNTEQVKNLSMLFLQDEGKFNFYNASYEHVSDKENFLNLSVHLSDADYINRFRAMLR